MNDTDRIIRALAERIARLVDWCTEGSCSCGQMAAVERELQPVRALIEAAEEMLPFVRGMQEDAMIEHFTKVAESAGAAAAMGEKALASLRAGTEEGKK